MPPTDLRPRTLALIARCRALRGIPVERIDKTEELASVGEWKVALENLCEHLYDAELSVPPDIVDEIKRLAEAMRLKEHYWRRFTPGWQPPPR